MSMSAKDYVLIAAVIRRANETATPLSRPHIRSLAIDMRDALRAKHNARGGYAFKPTTFMEACGFDDE